MAHSYRIEELVDGKFRVVAVIRPAGLFRDEQVSRWSGTYISRVEAELAVEDHAKRVRGSEVRGVTHYDGHGKRKVEAWL